MCIILNFVTTYLALDFCVIDQENKYFSNLIDQYLGL